MAESRAKSFEEMVAEYKAQQEAMISILTKMVQSQSSIGVPQPVVADPGRKSASPGYHPSLRIDSPITAAEMAPILQQSTESGQKHYMETYFWRQQQARGDPSLPSSSAPVAAADSFPKSPCVFNPNGFVFSQDLPPLKFHSGLLTSHSLVSPCDDDEEDDEDVETVAFVLLEDDGIYSEEEVFGSNEDFVKKPIMQGFDEENSGEVISENHLGSEDSREVEQTADELCMLRPSDVFAGWKERFTHLKSKSPTTTEHGERTIPGEQILERKIDFGSSTVLIMLPMSFDQFTQQYQQQQQWMMNQPHQQALSQLIPPPSGWAPQGVPPPLQAQGHQYSGDANAGSNEVRSL